VENDLFLFGAFGKKLLDIRAEALEDIHQRCDRRGCQIPLQLGNKAFGQLAPVGEFFLGKAFLYSQFFQSVSYIHMALHVLPITSGLNDNKHKVYFY